MAATTPSTAVTRWRLLALSLAMLLPSLGTSIANVALPTLANSFGSDFAQVQWLVIAYLLSVTTLIVGAGRLGDMLGRRRMLHVGIAVFTGASLACAVAPSLWLLVAARAMQGAGAAFMMSLAIASVADSLPRDQTGRAIGLLGTVSAVGTAAGLSRKFARPSRMRSDLHWAEFSSPGAVGPPSFSWLQPSASSHSFWVSNTSSAARTPTLRAAASLCRASFSCSWRLAPTRWR